MNDPCPTRAERRRWRRRTLLILAVGLVLVAITLVLGHRSFQTAADASVEEFGRRQSLLATEAAGGIEYYFEILATALRPLAEEPEVVSLAEGPTRRLLRLKAAELKRLGVWDVGVLDARGTLRYSAADTPMEGTDLSGRRYFQEARESEPEAQVVEFIEIEALGPGTEGVLLGVPMFGPAAEGSEEGRRFAGIVACLVALDVVAEQFVAPIQSHDAGQGFLIDGTGRVLWSPRSGQVGTDILAGAEEASRFREVVANMRAGQSGRGEFRHPVFGEDAGAAAGAEPKLIAYAPIQVGDLPWSIGVVAPKAQALALVRSARLTQALVVGFSTLVVLLAGGAAVFLCRRLRGLLEREVDRKTRQLQERQEQIEASRRELAGATDKAAELIETAAREQNLGLYFHNPHLVTCWKVRECSNTWCPCHGRENIRCWQVEGTYCDQEKPASFTDKVLQCRTCEVYRRSCPDRLTELAEGFNTMMHLLHHKAEEMRQLRYQALQRQRMATIGQMAAGIAHDIDNPIASLFSLVQLLSTSDLDEEAKARLALMRQCIERISKTVRQVVDFGRPVGQDEWTYGDVRKTIEDTVNLLRYDRRARSVNLAVECEPDLPKTMVIEHQLQQVFMNIMVNALDAMDGAGTLSVRATCANGAIEVAISDTGQGMRPEQIQHIFEPFYTTKAGHKGTGLGLALSFSSIQRHGGTIRVHSEPGEGSTFTVSIPLRSSDGGDHAPRQNPGR